MEREEFVEMKSITKKFPGVVANDDVSMSVRKGEIHGLLGENGAGKSTLMKTLYGLYSPTSGTIEMDGEELEMDSPQDAIDAGIGMVHQHFKLIPRLSVARNVVLGKREPASVFRTNKSDKDDGASSLIRSNPLLQSIGSKFTLGLEKPKAEIQSLADKYGFDIDVSTPVWQLDIGERQRVEILKALYRNVDLLILDEPTAVLTPNEAERLFETFQKLADQGLSIIIITHKLDEIKSVTDRVTVLREGEHIGTVETESASRDDLAEMMVGREVLFNIDAEHVQNGEPVLEASNIHADDSRGIEALSGVDLTVHEGEVVGVAGVSGNGQLELAEAVAGVRDTTSGSITVNGADLTNKSTRTFLDNGVSFVPEDRHLDGCAGSLSVTHNSIMKAYRKQEFGEKFRIDYDYSASYAESLVEEFDVRGINNVSEVKAGELSGGNLQKLILAREIERNPDLLIASQPTRGVDVGAIEFIRQRLLDQRDEGTGILLMSEDLDELFDLSDRILVIYEGEIVYETTPEEGTQQRIGLEMNGGETASEITRGAETVATDGGSE